MNRKTGQLLKPFKNEKGYLLVFLYINGKKKTKRVSRLVAEAFMPVRYVMETEVDHLDSKTNNHYKYLEWVTHEENIRRAKERKLFKPKFGKNNPLSSHSDEIVHRICQILTRAYKAKDIVEKIFEEFNERIHISYVYRIKNRQIRQDISSNYNF